jgi:hypothetical protein
VTCTGEAKSGLTPNDSSVEGTGRSVDGDDEEGRLGVEEGENGEPLWSAGADVDEVRRGGGDSGELALSISRMVAWEDRP